MHQRRHNDHSAETPRATYAPNSVLNNCKLVQFGSFAYAALLALGFEAIDRDADCVLMKAPEGFEMAGVN